MTTVNSVNPTSNNGKPDNVVSFSNRLTQEQLQALIDKFNSVAEELYIDTERKLIALAEIYSTLDAHEADLSLLQARDQKVIKIARAIAKRRLSAKAVMPAWMNSTILDVLVEFSIPQQEQMVTWGVEVVEANKTSVKELEEVSATQLKNVIGTRNGRTIIKSGAQQLKEKLAKKAVTAKNYSVKLFPDRDDILWNIAKRKNTTAQQLIQSTIDRLIDRSK